MFPASGLLTGDHIAGVGDVMGFVKHRFIRDLNDTEMQRQDNYHEQTEPFVFPFTKPG
jgi:hypothetical protein